MLLRLKKVGLWAFRLLSDPCMRAGANSRFCAALYYTLFNNGFSYEQRAFIAGKRAYADSLITPSASMALLRRNIHRLEKGLLMRPRKVPFGLTYISETTKAFSLVAASQSIDEAEFRWAHDVLGEYFTVCGGCNEVTDAQRIFQESQVDCRPRDIRNIPYRRDLTGRPSVALDDLLELAKRRRSVRWFLPRSLERHKIDAAITVAALSPSACNRQPFEFRVFDKPELIQQIAQIPGGTKGYWDNIPCIVVVVGSQRHYFDERDRHLIYIDASLAVMSFLFALECQNISSCCINWPEVASNDERLSKLLQLDMDQRAVMLIAVGYPDPEGDVAYSAKKSLSVLRRYNHE